MYALYVKNKPVSDRLLAENGKFFQTKQAELGDKMDLASYLLKPVQRLGKYSLFLDGISRTNGPKSELIKARTIIQFQVSPKKNNWSFPPKMVIFDQKILGQKWSVLKLLFDCWSKLSFFIEKSYFEVALQISIV